MAKSQLTYSSPKSKPSVHGTKNPSGSASTGPSNKMKAPAPDKDQTPRSVPGRRNVPA